MILEINVKLAHGVDRPVDLILQIQAPSFPDQRVLSDAIDFGLPEHVDRIAGEAGLGERILIRTT